MFFIPTKNISWLLLFTILRSCEKSKLTIPFLGRSLELGGVHKLHLQDFVFLDHLPPSVYIFYGIKVYKKSIFLTTYPPPLVNAVRERPLIWMHQKSKQHNQDLNICECRCLLEFQCCTLDTGYSNAYKFQVTKLNFSGLQTSQKLGHIFIPYNY